MSKWGKVSANGMEIMADVQLVLIDTPWDDSQTQSLVQWFESQYDVKDIIVIFSDED